MQKAILFVATACLNLSTVAVTAQAQPSAGDFPPTMGDLSQGGRPYQQTYPGTAPAMQVPDMYPRQSAPPANLNGYYAGPRPGNGAPGKTMSVAQWFNAYDSVRRQAQMNPVEKQRADALLSKGMSMMMPGDDKIQARAMLNSMVARYQKASSQLKQIPQLQQTANLHMSYYQYFSTAGNLFADYIRVQDNLFQTDTSGQPLAASLLQRKKALEALEAQCKLVDAEVRAQFKIAPYRYQ